MPANLLTCGNASHDHNILNNLLSETQAASGDECMVCLSDISDVKVRHKTCSFQACKPCLLTWLSTEYTCPFCRGVLKTKCAVCHVFDNDDDGDEEEDEIAPILAARAVRPAPDRFVVVSHLAAIHSMLISTEVADAHQSDTIWTHINNDVEDSMLLLESEDRGADGLRTIRAEDLIRGTDDFHLDQKSIQQLWIATRIMGVRYFYLTRVATQPGIGFWTPLIPDFHIYSSRAALPIREQEIRAQLGGGSMILPIPIPVRVFCDILRSTRRMYPWESDSRIPHIYELAQNSGITHYGFVDLRGQGRNVPTWDVNGFYAVPSQQLPSFVTHDVSARLGWPTDFDQEMITSVTSLFESQTDLDYDAHTYEYFGMRPTDVYENPQTYGVVDGSMNQSGLMELDYD